jgi:Tfp pilus assembly protein PilF
MRILKFFLTSFTVVFLSSAMTTSAFAISFTKVGKAEDKIIEARNLAKNGLSDQSAERLKQAESLLTEALADSPNDHEAQKLLGQCYWLKGDENRAETLFKNAAEDPSSRSDVVKFLKSEEDTANANGDYRRVLRLYGYAVDIEPSQKGRIVDKLKTDAGNVLKAGKYDLAQIYYQYLIRFEPSFKEQAYSAFYQAGNDNTDPRTRIHLYRVAFNFGNENRAAIIDAVAAIAKAQDRKLVESEIMRFPTDESKKIVAMAWPPDWQEFGLGYHEIKDIQPGKGSVWLRLKDGIRGKINFAASNDNFFLLIRDRNSGEIKKLDWANGERNWGAVFADYKIVPKKAVIDAYFIFK